VGTTIRRSAFLRDRPQRRSPELTEPAAVAPSAATAGMNGGAASRAVRKPHPTPDSVDHSRGRGGPHSGASVKLNRKVGLDGDRSRTYSSALALQNV
jgi:hypothetical protein